MSDNVLAVLADFPVALRQLRRAPGFVAAASLTLALGIGANTAIFSIVNGFFRPLPVPDPDRIVVIAAALPGDETGLRYRFSFPAVEDYRREGDVFSDVFAFDVRISGLSINSRPAQFVYQTVTGNFFTGLGLTPAAGRLFLPGEGEQPNSEPIIVLGHSFWQRRFAGDPNVVGRTVRLDGRSARIIGVAPEGFRGMFEGSDMDGYVPLGGSRGPADARQVFTDRGFRPLTMAARLQPEVSLAKAQSAVDVIARSLAERYPATERGTTARVIPEQMARPVPLPFLMHLLPFIRLLLFVLSSLVLLIACMNVANLLLVRATVRQREMAVRAALGAGRQRLVRLLLTESLLLAALGSGLGLLLGKWLSVMFAGSIELGTDVPFRIDFSFDWRVFSYALAMMLVTGLVLGVLPALRAWRAEVTDLLHDGGRGGSSGAGRQRVRSLLVVSQLAGSVALLVVAGLFVRNLQQAQQVDLGFDASSVLTARLDPKGAGYDAERTDQFYDTLQRRLSAIPGVESASMSFSVPLGYIFANTAVRREEDEKIAEEPRASIGMNSVSPEYFTTLRIPIVSGRSFSAHDTMQTQRVAIVNETMAARYWPNQDAVGRRFETPTEPGPLWEVVGVARDSKYLAVFETPLPYFYLPITQRPTFLRSIQLRSSIPSAELAALLQREVEMLDPDLPVADLRSLQAALNGNIGFVLFRIGAVQAGGMSVLGLVLAVIGVYGVVSYRTAQRSREIGIRMALGAVPGDVRRLVLRQAVGLVGVGIGLGLVLTWGLTGALTRVLLLVSSTDPLTFVAMTLLLSVSALVACYLPARRAMRVEPVVALRHE